MNRFRMKNDDIWFIMGVVSGILAHDKLNVIMAEIAVRKEGS